MDVPFDAKGWQPTKPPRAEEHETELSSCESHDLINSLGTCTSHTLKHPYDPRCWLARARVLQELQYPELAVGDAYKALRLCQEAVKRLHLRENGGRLGYRMGFWMREEMTAEREEETRQLLETLSQIQAASHEVQDRNLRCRPDDDEGRYLQRPYPWMAEKHRARDDALLARMNKEFADQALSGSAGAPRCVVERHAFGEAESGRDTSNVLGVFATTNLQKETVLLTDTTRTWGCNGPGEWGNDANMKGERGCYDLIHPNLPTEGMTQDLRWIRDRIGSRAADTIVRCRFLICAMQDNIDHPLDHHLLARLTPTYARTAAHCFHLEDDIAIMNETLQQFGIDIFANPNFDTWILFELRARTDNNRWSNPLHHGVSPLFTLFNHSCEPNADWVLQADGSTVIVTTQRNVCEGEQLFVSYMSGFLETQPLRKRRQELMRWLDGDCQCSRCVREEAEAAAIGSVP